MIFLYFWAGRVKEFLCAHRPRITEPLQFYLQLVSFLKRKNIVYQYCSMRMNFSISFCVIVLTATSYGIWTVTLHTTTMDLKSIKVVIEV